MLRKIRICNYNVFIFIYFANIKYKLVITSFNLKNNNSFDEWNRK